MTTLLSGIIITVFGKKVHLDRQPVVIVGQTPSGKAVPLALNADGTPAKTAG